MKSEAYKGHLAMLMANVLWGCMSPSSKIVLSSGLINAISLTTFRMLGAAIVFWIASIFTRKEHVPHEDLKHLFFAALFGIVFNQGTYIFGVSQTSPIDATIVATSTPIITMIIAAFYLKEPITGTKILGIFVGAAGALTLILSGQQTAVTGNGSNNVWGDILCLIAQCSFSIYVVVYKGLIGRYSPVTLMKWMFTYSAICTIPFSYNSVVSIDFATLPLEYLPEHRGCRIGRNVLRLPSRPDRPTDSTPNGCDHVQLCPTDHRIHHHSHSRPGHVRTDEKYRDRISILRGLYRDTKQIKRTAKTAKR